MPVEIRNDQNQVAVDMKGLQRVARRLLSGVGHPESTLSILLTDDRQMSQVHKKWMGESGPTDVLAFPMIESQGGSPGRVITAPPDFPKLLGDIVISVETAARRDPKNTMGEIIRCMIHGLLHLMGHDHAKSQDRLRMEREAGRLSQLLVS